MGSILDAETVERRFRQLEARIAALAPAGSSSIVDNGTLRAAATPPKPSGLTASANAIGTVIARWSAPPIPDLRRYELQYADNANFVGSTTISTRETSFTLDGAAAGTTYYFRVRAINSAGNPSGYTTGVSSAPGSAATSNIAAAASGELATYTKSAFFSLLSTMATVRATDGTDTTLREAEETYGPVRLTVDDANFIVLPRIIFEVKYASQYGGLPQIGDANNITVSLLRAAQGESPVTIESTTNDLFSTIPTSGSGSIGNAPRVTFPTLTPFDQPGAGTWDYYLKVALQSGGVNGIVFQGVALQMQFHVLKR